MSGAVMNTICDLKHKEIDLKMEDYSHTLYGNGNEGIKSIVQRHDMVLKGVLWIGGIFAAATVTMLTAIFWKVVLNGAAISEIVSIN